MDNLLISDTEPSSMVFSQKAVSKVGKWCPKSIKKKAEAKRDGVIHAQN